MDSDAHNLLLVRNFGALLEAYIDEAGFSSITAFAESAGATAQTVSKCIRGIVGPPLDQLERWCDTLKLRGEQRRQFIHAGWRAKAWAQSEANPWLKHVESEVNKGRRSLRHSGASIEWYMERTRQLEEFIKRAGDDPPPPTGPPPKPPSPDDEPSLE